MFENFDIGISKLFKNAEKIRYDLKHPYVGSEHLMLAILKQDNAITKLLKKYNITYNSFKKELISIVGHYSKTVDINLYTPMLKKIIDDAIQKSINMKDDKVSLGQLVLSLFEIGEGIALRVLLLLNIDIEKLYDELKNLCERETNLNIENVVILNDIVNEESNIIGREKEISEIIEVLLRHKKNNPILVGKAGVGKTAIVEELARRINNKEVPKQLYDYKILTLEMGNLIAGTKYRGEFEEKLTKIINKVINNSNIIIFIDEIHSMVNAGSSDGAISASDILKPYLSKGNLKIIGATTINEYNKYFLKDKALTRRFEKIYINEPSIKETKKMLYKVKDEYENYHGVKITNKNINDIVYYGSKYIMNKCNPDKSVELLDTICAKIKCQSRNIDINSRLKEINKLKNECIKNNNFSRAIIYKIEENKIKNRLENIKELKITRNDILKIIQDRTCIPLVDKNYIHINSNDINYINEKELNLLNKVANTLDINSLLLIGDDKKNKDEIVNLIKNNRNIIKIDSNDIKSINKLIGIPFGYEGASSSYIFEEVREHSYSLIYIDNFECANIELINLIKNILDNHLIKDNHNEYINFNSCLFVFNYNKNISKIGFKNNINISNKIDRDIYNRLSGCLNTNKIDCKQFN